MNRLEGLLNFGRRFYDAAIGFVCEKLYLGVYRMINIKDHNRFVSKKPTWFRSA